MSATDRKKVKRVSGGIAPQKPQNFEESKLPKCLSAMVAYVKKTKIWTKENIKHTHQYMVLVVID